MLKAGSKRRRKQADIAGQIEEQEMAGAQAQEQSQRIAELEQGPAPVLQTAVDAAAEDDPAEGPLKTVAVKMFKVVSFMLVG